MNNIGIWELLAALGGFEGIKWLVNFFAYRKQEKRIKDADVNKAESEADKSNIDKEKFIRDMYEETLSEMRTEYIARINELRQANAEMNKQNLELIKELARKGDEIADKTSKIRELQELRVEDAKKIGELEGDVQYLDNWKCFREYGKCEDNCERRKPQQELPMKYKPRKNFGNDAV